LSLVKKTALSLRFGGPPDVKDDESKVPRSSGHGSRAGRVSRRATKRSAIVTAAMNMALSRAHFNAQELPTSAHTDPAGCAKMQKSGNRNRWYFQFGNSSRQAVPAHVRPASRLGKLETVWRATPLVVFPTVRTDRHRHEPTPNQRSSTGNNSKNTKRVTSSLLLLRIFFS
jgi:hypothetical protein